MSEFSKLPKVEKPNVFIATPLAKNALIHAETARYCAVLNQHPSVVWAYTNTMSAELSRNSLLEHHFHKDPCWTHTLFLDSDIAPPPNALALLLQLGADVAVGLCPIYADKKAVWNVQVDKNASWIPMTEQLPEKPFEVSSAGAGCLLVRREVLVDVEYPWFKTEYQEVFKNQGKGIKQGEDVYFIKKVLGKGYKVIAHPDVKCHHFNQVDLLDYFIMVKRQIEDSNRNTDGQKESS